MSTIPGQKIEHNRDIPTVGSRYGPPPLNHPNDDQEVY
jgi:hypothetical protein